ncbi:MAG: hypothetical protein EPN79_11905 [Burkholderiaceae bacterium]|nr:MAG: hypothetical protein EPN79_11905 [Burkholderiaceae bacterium]TBR76872.1 MAG: hypothetical protein EPN64_06525 [Burkholderiaceae bacterium]
MAKIISMAGWRELKAQAMQSAPSLECPQCASVVAALNVDADSTTTYRCAGHGHRALTWRINSDGDMLRGATGQRYY